MENNARAKEDSEANIKNVRTSCSNYSYNMVCKYALIFDIYEVSNITEKPPVILETFMSWLETY